MTDPNQAAPADRFASRAARFGPAPNSSSNTTSTTTIPQQQHHQQQRQDVPYHHNNANRGYGGHRRPQFSGNNTNNNNSNARNEFQQQPQQSATQHAAYAQHGVVPSSSNNFHSRRPHQPAPVSSRANHHHDRNRKPMASYDEKCAVRIGVLDARRAITEQDIMNELEHIRLSSKVEAIFIESASSLRSSPDSSLERDEQEANKHKEQQQAASSDTNSAATTAKDKTAILTEIGEGEPKIDPHSGLPLQWARVFMSNADVADECAAEFAFPGAEFRWRLIVQRLPIVNHFAELTKKLASPDHRVNQAIANHIYHPLQNCPIPQVIVVDTQEGYVPFMTTEMFQTKGASDYLANKGVASKAHLMRRSVCKHYDPQSETDCFFGVNCSFIHLHAAVLDRLLRIQSFKTRLRLPAAGVVRRPEDAIQHSNWEVERRQDTLMVRDIPESVGDEQLNYMFSGCPGFVSSAVRQTPYEGRRYGVVRLGSRRDAMQAMAQTFGCGLSISFFGALEDLRGIRIKETLHEEEDARRRKIQEREERMSFRHNQNQHQQQQQYGNSDAAGGEHKDNKIMNEANQLTSSNEVGYTSKKFGGGGVADREAGQRRQRENENDNNVTVGEGSKNEANNSNNNEDSLKSSKKNSGFANEVLELRQSDSDNDDNADNNSNNRNNKDNEGGRYSNDAKSLSRSNGNDSNKSNSDNDYDDDDDDDEEEKHAGVADDSEPNSEVALPINMAKPTEKDFPPLPQGWDWGFTRRLSRYYFFETLKRNKTSWKHPVTNKSYAVGGAEC